MKQDASYFDGKEAILIYIAKRLNDALQLESILTQAGIQYGVEVDYYQGGVIFRRQRAGAFFYVLPDSLDLTHRIMQQHGYEPFVE
jgi:hypothetical protein